MVVQENESAVVEEGVGQFFPFREPMLIKSIMVVGYGNTVNDWNRWEIILGFHWARIVVGDGAVPVAAVDVSRIQNL